MTRMKALAERKVTETQVEAFLNRVLAASGVVPTTDKALKALLEMYRTGQGADLPSAHGTAWGLVNAVTGYVDHQKRPAVSITVWTQPGSARALSSNRPLGTKPSSSWPDSPCHSTHRPA